MNKTELIEFLKDNLKINLTEKVLWSGNKEIELSLILKVDGENQVISKEKIII